MMILAIFIEWVNSHLTDISHLTLPGNATGPFGISVTPLRKPKFQSLTTPPTHLEERKEEHIGSGRTDLNEQALRNLLVGRALRKRVIGFEPTTFTLAT